MYSNYVRGLKKANSFIAEAQAELGTSGYRENLGYERYRNLQDYLYTLSLTYQEESSILRIYEEKCEKL